MAAIANHAGVLRSGHNADMDSPVAIADDLLKHHDILLSPTVNPASPSIHKKRAREAHSISVGSSSPVPVLLTKARTVRPALRYAPTGSHLNPSPQRLIWPQDGDGKCAGQHRVLLSQ